VRNDFHVRQLADLVAADSPDLYGIAGGTCTGPPGLARQAGRGRVADKDVQDLADGPFPTYRFPEGQVGLDLVAVTTGISVLVLDDVPRGRQVSHDGIGATLSYAQGGGNVPQARSGVMGDTDQYPGMVGKKTPLWHRHYLTL
jgi:hypothetical protein